MHTNTQFDYKFKFVYWAQIFLMIGFLSSPTIVSLYHILIIIPAIIIFFDSYKKITITKSSWLLILLFTWGFVCTALNHNDLTKPLKSYGELKYYFFGWLLIYPLYFFYDRVEKKHVLQLIKLLAIIIIVGFFVGIIKSWLKFDLVKWKYDPTFHVRSGGFLNYMRYGYASGLLFLLGLSLYFNKDKLSFLWDSKWIKFAIVFSFLAILTSQTRGALLGLIVAMPFLLKRYYPLVSKVLFIGGSVFLLLVAVISMTGLLKNRYLNINESSNNARSSQFYTAYKAISENPILGLGADQFSYNVKSLKQKYGIWASTYSGHAHNIFLEHGASYGIPGIVILILFLGFWFYEMYGLKDNLGWAVCSYIIAFVASGQVENLFDNANTHLFFYIYSVSQVYILLRNDLLKKLVN